MDLSKYNLNLLLAFHILMKERQVTRAAKRLHLTQSAMSSILKQLRILFEDELFVRGQANQMIPTPKAISLIDPINQFFQQAHIIFNQVQPFDPKLSTKIFTLGLMDYCEFLLLPILLNQMQQQAPNMSLKIQHLNFIDDKEHCFEQDEIDLAILVNPKVPERLVAEILFTDNSVCVGHKTNPLLERPLTLKKFAAANQALVLYKQTREELFIENFLKKEGLQRHIVATVPNTFSALNVVSKTSLIVVMLERIAKTAVKTLPIRIQPLPFKYPKPKVKMIWHPKNRNDAAHTWLRQLIRNILTSNSDFIEHP